MFKFVRSAIVLFFVLSSFSSAQALPRVEVLRDCRKLLQEGLSEEVVYSRYDYVCMNGEQFAGGMNYAQGSFEKCEHVPSVYYTCSEASLKRKDSQGGTTCYQTRSVCVEEVDFE